MRRALASLVIVAFASIGLVACSSPAETAVVDSVIPAPVSRVDSSGTFSIEGASVSGPVSSYAAEVLELAEGDGEVVLAIESGPAPEGYVLDVTGDGIRIEASDEAGIFNGIQTLRQLVVDAQVAFTHIEDYPRFAYRGAMLDVARHFFEVDDVKRYIDDIAQLKINYLHLHLTDDQGWRIQIDSWPNLTKHGSTSAVGGIGGVGPGFYTKADYKAIVDYAASRFITIVPEIDMPGHTNAALSSYPKLNCDGKAPELYTGIEVGFSSLCIDKEITYEFVSDVLGELAEMTPGPYIHIGGDEARSTTEADFKTFLERVTAMGTATGKTLVGWQDIGRSTDLPAGTIGQYWGYVEPEGTAADEAQSIVDQGGQLIMSPADMAYLDMKYNFFTQLGQTWAKGYTSVEEAASWDPVGIVPGVSESDILGVEAPLWSETLRSIEDVEYMAFPRIAAIAETAWSPSVAPWDELKPRIAAFGVRLEAQGVNYNRAAGVDWIHLEP